MFIAAWKWYRRRRERKEKTVYLHIFKKNFKTKNEKDFIIAQKRIDLIVFMYNYAKIYLYVRLISCRNICKILK